MKNLKSKTITLKQKKDGKKILKADTKPMRNLDGIDLHLDLHYLLSLKMEILKDTIYLE